MFPLYIVILNETCWLLEWTRANAGLASQLQARWEDIPHPGSAPLVRDVPPHLMGPRPIPGPTIALYSDVVALRTPSPRVGAEAQLLAISPEDIDNERVPGRLVDRNLAHISTEQNNNSTKNPTSSEITNLPEDLEDGQWTTVRRRRARSLNSLERNPQVNRDIGCRNQTLTKEQVQVVQAAANELTITVVTRLLPGEVIPCPLEEKALLSRKEKALTPKNGGVFRWALMKLMSRPRKLPLTAYQRRNESQPMKGRNSPVSPKLTDLLLNTWTE